MIFKSLWRASGWDSQWRLEQIEKEEKKWVYREFVNGNNRVSLKGHLQIHRHNSHQFLFYYSTPGILFFSSINPAWPIQYIAYQLSPVVPFSHHIHSLYSRHSNLIAKSSPFHPLLQNHAFPLAQIPFSPNYFSNAIRYEVFVWSTSWGLLSLFWFNTGPLSEVQTAVGLEASMPCELVPVSQSMMTDKVQLVIWYKEGNIKPIYTWVQITAKANNISTS